MPLFDQLTKAWIDRQYRLTYRAVIGGLLASGQHEETDVIAKAHRLTVDSMRQYRKAEVAGSHRH